MNAGTYQNFNQRLGKIKLIADELPAALIIHRTADLNVVYMNKHGLKRLGISHEEFNNTDIEQCNAKYFNLEESNEYLSKITYLMNSKSNESVSYFQKVHSQDNTEWTIFASNTQVFFRDEVGKPTHIITIANNIDPVHHISTKVNRMMEELNFYRDKSPLFHKLTKREKEVLGCIALGMNSGEISNRLFISPATVDTHRRNLRSKLNLKNNYDTVKFAQAYNLV
jgi:DNA-binding CsgD family transcriptional regulator